MRLILGIGGDHLDNPGFVQSRDPENWRATIGSFSPRPAANKAASAAAIAKATRRLRRRSKHQFSSTAAEIHFVFDALNRV